MKYGRCALLSCTLVCIVALSCIEASGKSQRLNPEQLGAQPVSVGTSGRWLLASNETHLGREEEEICDLQPFASTPSYGIMRHIQTYLRMTATGPHKKLFPLSKGAFHVGVKWPVKSTSGSDDTFSSSFTPILGIIDL